MQRSWTAWTSIMMAAAVAAPGAYAKTPTPAPAQSGDIPAVVATTLIEACLPAAKGAELTPERAERLGLTRLPGRPAAIGARYADAAAWFGAKAGPGVVFVGAQPGACHVVVANTNQGREVGAKIASTMTMIGFKPDTARVTPVADRGRLFSGATPDGRTAVVGVDGLRAAQSGGAGFQGAVSIAIASPAPPEPAAAPLAARPVAVHDPELAQAAYRTVADLCLPMVRATSPIQTVAQTQADTLRAPPAELAAQYGQFSSWFAAKAKPDNLFVAAGDQPAACHVVIANTAEGPEIQDKTARTLMATGFLPISNWSARSPGVNDRLFARRGPDGYLLVRVSGAASTVRGGAGDQALIDVRLVAPAMFETLTSERAQLAQATSDKPLWTPTRY